MLVVVLGIVSALMLPMGPSFVLVEDSPADKAQNGEEEGDGESESQSNASRKKPLQATRIRRLIFHSEYIALLSWFSICIIPMQYYVGSIGFQLEDKDDDGFFTALFSVLYASAALLAPFGGYLADMLGLAVTQALATLLVASSMFILASPASLSVQSVGLATYSVGRMLSFGSRVS